MNRKTILEKYKYRDYLVHRVEIIDPPILSPVTIDELMSQGRLFNNEDEKFLKRIINAATEHGEKFMAKSFITRTLRAYLDYFTPVIYFPNPPLQAVIDIRYDDENGVEQIVDPAIYHVEVHHEPGYVILREDQSWPLKGSGWHGFDSVRINYKAGYGDDSTKVPQSIRQALLALCVAFYDNPSMLSPTGKSHDVEALYMNVIGAETSVY